MPALTSVKRGPFCDHHFASKVFSGNDTLARASALAAEADKHMAIKDGGNGLLQECSGKYNGLMKALRRVRR